MKWLHAWWLIACSFNFVKCFWEEGTTTMEPGDKDEHPRTSFFEWADAEIEPGFFRSLWGIKLNSTVKENKYKHLTACCCGLSIDFKPLTIGALLNSRTVLTSATPFEPYLHRMEDLRIWCMGRTGYRNTPWRYRVWMVRRVIPRSMNPEHQVGPRGTFTTRHDVAVVLSRDMIYYYNGYRHVFLSGMGYIFARWAWLMEKNTVLYQEDDFWECGSGFTNMEHVKKNFRLRYYMLKWHDLVNCENYLPKWWGKFICLRQNPDHANRVGVQNGAVLFSDAKVVGLGAFDIRYNNERICVYTDLRYYRDWIMIMANISSGEYYDYAYQAFGAMPTYKWVWGWWRVGEINPASIHGGYKLFPLGK